MRPRLTDWADVRLIWRSFLGATVEYPQPGKYDALQKLFHAALAMLAVLFTVTGALLWLSASRRAWIPRGWLHWSRLGHDIAAVTLAALVIGHIYFSLIQANRENLRDMLALEKRDA